MKVKQFQIDNVLNHNTLLCKSLDLQETYMFFGKGIGFKKKVGEQFQYDASISEAKLILEATEADQYKDLVERVNNKKLASVVQDVVQEADRFFDHKINWNLNITMLDHLNFAIERQKQDINITYPFLHELKYIYPKEYEFSKKAFAYINTQMKGEVEFLDSELGFLVLHIHAAVADRKVSKVLQNNKILYECITIIEENLHIEINRNSIYYLRFVKHLEFAIHRSKNNIKLENVLLDSVRKLCCAEYEIAQKICVHVKKTYYFDLDEDEIGYLALHIYNIKQKK